MSRITRTIIEDMAAMPVDEDSLTVKVIRQERDFPGGKWETVSLIQITGREAKELVKVFGGWYAAAAQRRVKQKREGAAKG